MDLVSSWEHRTELPPLVPNWRRRIERYNFIQLKVHFLVLNLYVYELFQIILRQIGSIGRSVGA